MKEQVDIRFNGQRHIEQISSPHKPHTQAWWESLAFVMGTAIGKSLHAVTTPREEDDFLLGVHALAVATETFALDRDVCMGLRNADSNEAWVIAAKEFLDAAVALQATLRDDDPSASITESKSIRERLGRGESLR